MDTIDWQLPHKHHQVISKNVVLSLDLLSSTSPISCSHLPLTMQCYHVLIQHT
jgi:hypothetical protein